MKKVLFLSYFFPPAAGGGVKRSAKFVQYLPEFGWEPLVVAPPETYFANRDNVLMSSLSEQKIYRIDAGFLGRFALKRQWLRGALDRLMVPDASLLWTAHLHSFLEKVIRAENVDLIYTSCKPFSLNLEGIRLKRQFNIPWVTDFRDPWTDNAEFHRSIFLPGWKSAHRRFEEKVVETCDHYIANTPTNQRLAISRFPALASKSTVITNGFDPTEFAGGPVKSSGVRLKASQPSVNIEGTVPGGDEVALSSFRASLDKIGDGTERSRPLGPFKFVYTGACYGEYNPHQMFRWLAEFRRQNPECAFEIHYAGLYGNAFRSCGQNNNLQDLIHYHGYLPHSESLELMRNADALLLFLPKVRGAQGWVPAKLYEYLATGRPIFAAIPNGDASNLITECQAGVILDPDTDSNAATQALKMFWKSSLTNSSPKIFPQVKKFEWLRLVEKLAHIFESVAGKRRTAVPS